MAGVKESMLFIKSLFKRGDQKKIEASGYGSHASSSIFSIPFDGEKNLGEIGPAKDYVLQYDLLRLRSWQSYLDSEITQTVVNKYTKWVVGSGLKLQSEPNKIILESEGVKIDFSEFSKMTEARFNLFSKSKRADFSKMSSLNKLTNTAFLNAKIGGDVLVIMRYENKQVTVQLVDGQHVRYHGFGGDYWPVKMDNGNVVKNGIEFNSRGEHVAYWVSQKNDLKSKRVKAKNSKGITQAFMYYGFKYRLDNHRGIPLISAVLETLKKLERYKEATVGSAEERAKVVGFIKHELGGTGENPMNKQMAKAFDADANYGDSDLAIDADGNALADKVAATTNKQMFNLPQGASMDTLDTKNDLYFKDFYDTNIDIICACLGIPPEVAMSKYDSNFSASRAALKDWEHTLLVERNLVKEDFLQLIYDYWFEVMIHENKIQAPGYIMSPVSSDVREAYRNCRFIGANVPHIDPLKEVMAERAKLGDTGKAMPLTTLEMATETLNGGDSQQNLSNFAKEKDDSEGLGIKVDIPVKNSIEPKEDIKD